MDFRLYARVLWRFRLVVALGLVLGLALATLSMVRVSRDGIEYRQAELWSSTTRLGVTQSGFPWGRLFAQGPGTGEDVPTAAEEAKRLGIPVADPARFNTLAVLYSELATSDPVRRVMLRRGKIRGEIAATPIVADKTGTMLPLIEIFAVSTSPREAMLLARRAGAALSTYVREQQRANKVPEADRVIVEEILRPQRAQVFQPRPKTMPIVIFAAVMFVTIGLAFVLENVRPRSSVFEPEDGLQPAQQRLSA